MRAFIGPPHLALLGHAKADHFVYRRLGNSTADRQSPVVPSSVVHQIPVVRSETPPGASQISDQRGILRVVHIIDSVMNTLEPGHCLRSLAVPDQPFARSDFVTQVASVWCQQVRVIARRQVDGPELHGDVEPVEDAAGRA